MTRSLVILTLNEIDGVRALIPKLPRSYVDETIAVDGGSTDGTREFLIEQDIKIVDQERRGRGAAFRVAMRATSGAYVVFFSPDGNEDPADILPLFEKLEGGADMAIASRFLKESRNEEDDDFLAWRKWANQGFTVIANLIWNRKGWISDTINGFRGVRRSIFWQLKPESMGYTIEYELTIRAIKAGLTIVEIPTIESARIGGETKAPSVRTGLIFTKFLLQELFRR